MTEPTKVIEPTAVVEPVPAVKPTAILTLDELKAAMGKALAEGNDTEMIAISKLILKQKSDVEKAEANKLTAEAEALSGVREALAKGIWTDINAETKAELLKVKATGFTFKLDGTPEGVSYKSVSLTVPTVKTKKTGGGGSTGNLKRETGLSRHELIDQYATEAEKLEIQSAQDNAATRPDSARYSAEKPVIKRILANNPELVKH